MLVLLADPDTFIRQRNSSCQLSYLWFYYFIKTMLVQITEATLSILAHMFSKILSLEAIFLDIWSISLD
jgi:hypothetical protein